MFESVESAYQAAGVTEQSGTVLRGGFAAQFGVLEIALGRVSGGDVVVGYERIGAGDVVVVADSDPFGYVMTSGDDLRFVKNLALLQ